MHFSLFLNLTINTIESRYKYKVQQLDQWNCNYKQLIIIKLYALLTDLRAFRIRHIHDQLIKINHIPFCILHPLFEANVRDFPAGLYPKCYCYRSEFYNISNYITCNIFSILKVVSSTHILIIWGLFFNKGCI